MNSELISKDQQIILDRIEILYQQNQFQEAYNTALSFFKENFAECKEDEYFFNTKLICIMIDAGSILHDVTILENSIAHIEKNIDFIQNTITAESIEYNLGNAKGALFDSKRKQDISYLKPEMADLLIEAKNHYWKAFKYSDKPQTNLLINLASKLSTCGRVVEALYFYDMAIERSKDFGEAFYNKAMCLKWASELSNSPSFQMYYIILKNYELAMESKDLPAPLIEQAHQYVMNLKKFLQSHGYDESHFKDNDSQTANEFKQHSKYRKFCLENNLALSEHALYCHCNGARNDNLSIASSVFGLGGEFIGRHENVLNRLKLEFNHARTLFWRATMLSDSEYAKYDEELCLSEMMNGEHTDTRSEDIRSSFKKCFGILDKIAIAICSLYKLELNEDEPIYFNSFWKKPKAVERWDTLNQSENYSLYALFYQATELNSKTGSWKEFKEWRNALEHNFLALFKNIKNTSDPFHTHSKELRIVKVEYDIFKEKTKHLLHFTQSAIFNYVFCVRNEALKQNNHKEDAIKIQITKKFQNAD